MASGWNLFIGQPYDTEEKVSVLDPIRRTDYIIKEKQVRELLSECEVGKRFLADLNFKVVQLIVAADTRRKVNKRKRIFSCDL